MRTLRGKDQQTRQEWLYFEIDEPYFQQAVRMGDWKGFRLGTKAPLELYDLKADPVEKQNVAAAHPDIVRKIEGIM
jgi:arylsulfatase A-like enzyme